MDHPWLDEVSKRGRKRERYEKELIVTGLLNNGPQPRTREDEAWRKADKLQRYTDVFVTAVPQSELIRAEWSSEYPEMPPDMYQGAPARFGRRVSDRGLYTRAYDPTSVRPVFDRGLWLAPAMLSKPTPMPEAQVPQAEKEEEEEGDE